MQILWWWCNLSELSWLLLPNCSFYARIKTHVHFIYVDLGLEATVPLWWMWNLQVRFSRSLSLRTHVWLRSMNEHIIISFSYEQVHLKPKEVFVMLLLHEHIQYVSSLMACYKICFSVCILKTKTPTFTIFNKEWYRLILTCFNCWFSELEAKRTFSTATSVVWLINLYTDQTSLSASLKIS